MRVIARPDLGLNLSRTGTLRASGRANTAMRPRIRYGALARVEGADFGPLVQDMGRRTWATNAGGGPDLEVLHAPK